MVLLGLAVFVLVFAMVAQRVSLTIFTPPQIFLGLGFLCAGSGVLPQSFDVEMLHIVAEVTLIILLFLDAAKTNIGALRRGFIWPARLLLIAMPLSIVVGTIFALPFLPGWSLASVALLAAIMTPTDAALGQNILNDPNIKERSRRTLLVESGVNDGLALPAILLLGAFASSTASAPQTGWVLFTLKQICIGPLVGLVMGYFVARLLLWAQRNGFTTQIYEGIAAIALAAATYLMATEFGGNGFIAAFSGGLAFGAVLKGQCRFVYEFTESEGQFLSWSAFFLIGAVLLPSSIAQLNWTIFFLIVVNLCLVRPIAVWLSLLRTDAKAPTRLFFGWFGPRGLASALFALIIIEEMEIALGTEILMTAINAVWISALLHGTTARLAARVLAQLEPTLSPISRKLNR